MEIQVNSSHYDFSTYLPKDRWASYWHQLNEVLLCSPQNLLVIGVGDGIVGKILETRGIAVKTFDYAAELSPDYLGDIRNLTDYVDNMYDCVLCCQVLEHLPFNALEQCIHQLHHVTGEYCILSLPHLNWSFRILIQFFNKQISKQVVFNRRNVHFPFDGEHYWEIGAQNSSLAEVENIIDKYFTIIRSYNVREKSYHKFFILKKK